MHPWPLDLLSCSQKNGQPRSRLAPRYETVEHSQTYQPPSIRYPGFPLGQNFENLEKTAENRGIFLESLFRRG